MAREEAAGVIEVVVNGDEAAGEEIVEEDGAAVFEAELVLAGAAVQVNK